MILRFLRKTKYGTTQIVKYMGSIGLLIYCMLARRLGEGIRFEFSFSLQMHVMKRISLQFSTLLSYGDINSDKIINFDRILIPFFQRLKL